MSTLKSNLIIYSLIKLYHINTVTKVNQRIR